MCDSWALACWFAFITLLFETVDFLVQMSSKVSNICRILNSAFKDMVNKSVHLQIFLSVVYHVYPKHLWL